MFVFTAAEQRDRLVFQQSVPELDPYAVSSNSPLLWTNYKGITEIDPTEEVQMWLNALPKLLYLLSMCFLTCVN